MKIKVRLIGQSFPQDLVGEEVEVDVASIYLPDGSLWTTDCVQSRCLGYEIEATKEKKEEAETPKKEDNSISFGSNSLKSLSVEFK